MKTYCMNAEKILNDFFLNGRLIMESSCPVCGIKKPRLVKEQEEKDLLSNLGIKTPLSQIPLPNILF